jgi:hypothetical protein
MIAAVSPVADKLATTKRPSGDEALRRAEAPKPANLTTNETDSAVVEISSQGASLAAAPAPAAPVAAAAPKQAAASAASTVSEFDEADANQDGTVNVLERRAFDFMHPTLARYPRADDETPPQKTVAAELKAYEAVARSGRDG